MSEHYYTQNPTSRHDVKRLNITLDGKVRSTRTRAFFRAASWTRAPSL